MIIDPRSRAYDPAEYENLPVNAEIKELFQYITRYTPQAIDLEHKLKPFIPDYIPAVGDIDAFIKVGVKPIEILQEFSEESANMPIILCAVTSAYLQ